MAQALTAPLPYPPLRPFSQVLTWPRPWLPIYLPFPSFSLQGTDLAQALTAKDAIAAKKAAMPADIAKAIARLSSGLYVVTAAHNNARSAMVASWVSQV